ncbi:MAG: flagellar biosynthetic protein FliO [Burkholderiaceae bacterium]
MATNLTPLLWFGVIVVLIPLALWLLKRTPLGGAGGSGPLRHVAMLPLSAAQRVAIVEVGSGTARRWLVLGVTAQAIHTLHTMEPQSEPPLDIAEPQASFAQLLARLKRNP